jgi:hypothetical protein
MVVKALKSGELACTSIDPRLPSPMFSWATDPDELAAGRLLPSRAA